MEDYNTGTLAHRKYYDLELYERQRAAKAARKGVDLVVRAATARAGGEGRGGAGGEPEGEGSRG